MRQYNGFDRNDIYRNAERLPAGGYIVKILEAKEIESDYGNKLLLSFDIEEGEHKGFFTANYKAQTGEDKKWKGTYRLNIPKDDGSEQDGWAKRRFNTMIVDIEESNPGYHWDWDESKLKGKIIGALFNNKEYEFNGRHGFFTNCHSLIPAERIRSGKFEIPADTLLNSNHNVPAPKMDANGFINVPAGIDEELPFN